MAVGARGTIVAHDGTRWRFEESGTLVTLRAVHGRSLDDLIAVGDDGIVLRRTSLGWVRTSGPPGGSPACASWRRTTSG